MSIDIYSIFGNPNNRHFIPTRDPSAVTGSQFINNNINLSGAIREQNILNEFLHGNVPDFLRYFTPITIAKGSNIITYLATSDYLSIGTDDDYVRMPMSPLTAQKIADQYDCTLPTRKMVNDIWSKSINKLEPMPWGPPFDHSMMSTERYGMHNDRIQVQLRMREANYKDLTSGHKKDVVLTNKLSPKNPKKRVAIYGWIHPSGQPIQGLNPGSHDWNYADYSHGIRLIANDVIVNNELMKIKDLFTGSLSYMVSDEGPLKFLRY